GGWLTAGSGRLDITGKPNGEAYYTMVALEQSKGPYIACEPVYQRGSHSPSAWKMSSAIRSWSYRGCEGYKAKIEVYARAHSVELLINGRSVGKKTSRNDCVFCFKAPYENGTITAISYDKDGRQIGRDELHTASSKTKLSLLPEKKSVPTGHLSYIRLRYTDENGVWKPMEKHRIKLAVENGTLLGFGSACPYQPNGYLNDTADTYYGEALAVIRVGEPGELKVSATDEGRTVELTQTIREAEVL
ncbi:MAG: DUF4982 domain-containing protein, partial [Lachnospiraceae bacterium]|nr:DUF4982 domain-containing protein [Lachnospiraceae bacterium]